MVCWRRTGLIGANPFINISSIFYINKVTIVLLEENMFSPEKIFGAAD